MTTARRPGPAGRLLLPRLAEAMTCDATAWLWLHAGVPPAEAARRLGRGVAVLVRVYANRIDGETTP